MFGGLLGAVSGWTAVEYYGVWKLDSLSWSLLQGSGYNLSKTIEIV